MCEAIPPGKAYENYPEAYTYFAKDVFRKYMRGRTGPSGDGENTVDFPGGVLNNWHNCYDDGWQGIIVPEAFAHPARWLTV